MKRGQTGSRWILLVALFAGGAIAVTMIVRSRNTKPVVPARPHITISMDAQGRTEIGGVSVGNTNLRDSALQLMNKLDIQPKIVVPRTMTNAQQASNFIQTLESLGRAGLSREKRPNPYE